MEGLGKVEVTLRVSVILLLLNVQFPKEEYEEYLKGPLVHHKTGVTYKYVVTPLRIVTDSFCLTVYRNIPALKQALSSGS